MNNWFVERKFKLGAWVLVYYPINQVSLDVPTLGRLRGLANEA